MGVSFVARAVAVRGGQARIEALYQLARGVDAAHPQQLVAGRHFDEDREVAAGRHRHANHRHLQSEQFVPRFIEADKPASQVGMDLLNIRYGLLTAEGTATTAIGWGLVAEAYANFGLAGVAAIGIFMGILFGYAGRLSAGAPVIWSAAF